MKTLFFNGKVYTGTLPLKDSFAVEDVRVSDPDGAPVALSGSR